MFIIREDLKAMQKMTHEERERGMILMSKWVSGLADSGHYLAGEPLEVRGRYVRQQEVLSDGPFIESKEGVSGFNLVQAESLEQATAIAQTCPLVVQGLAAIELRPLLTVPPHCQPKIAL